MALPMKEKNFMGMIYYKPTLLKQIEGLLDGDKLTFTTHINGETKVYVVDVSLVEDGSELWSFYMDNTSYYSRLPGPGAFYENKANVDIIKYSNSNAGTIGVLYSATPNLDIVNYIDIYIDAMQNH